MVETRKCRVCGVEKELTKENFRGRLRADGLIYFEYKCNPCRTARGKKWYADNREHCQKRDKKFREENPGLVRGWHRKNKEKHRAKYRKQTRERYQREIDKLRPYFRERAKAWREKNLLQSRLNAKQGRARRKNAKNHMKVTAAEIVDLFKKQRGKCAICHKKITIDNKNVDHIVPLAKGGLHEIKNIQLTCPPCNAYKHDRDPIDYMQKIGKLL